MNTADGNLPLSGDAVDSNSTAAALYRSPTWARNINFDSNFDINLAGSPEHSGYVSPAEVPNGLALVGSPQVEAFAEASGSKPQSASNSPTHSRNGSNLSSQLQSTSRNPSSHTRQGSNSNMISTSSKQSPTTSTSERTTPKSSHFPKSANTSTMPIQHQRNASAGSSNALADWSKPSASPQLHSSADIYAANPSGGGDQNRNSATLSMLGAASLEEIDDERRDSGADSTMAAKRASVLSFQTALSGMGAYDDPTASPAPDMERLDKSLPPRPWLHQPTELPSGPSSTFSTSPDDRHLPGSWGNARGWNQNGIDDIMPSSSSRYASPFASRNPSAERKNRSPAHSPKMQRIQLDENNSTVYQQHSHPGPLIPSPRASARTSPIMRQQATLPVPSPSAVFAEQRGFRNGSLLRNDTTGELLAETSPSQPISPLSGEATTIHETFASNREVVKSAPTKILNSERASPKEKGMEEYPTKQVTYQEKSARSSTTPVEQSPTSERQPPQLPEKSSPPTIPTKGNEVGLSSPPLSDNVIPPPLPPQTSGEKAIIPERVPANRSPVMEYRRKPLMQVKEAIEQQRPMKKQGENEAARSPEITARKIVAPIPVAPKVGPGIGAHALRNGGLEASAGPAFAAHMRGPIDSMGASRGVVNGASAMAPLAAPDNRSPSPSIDTPPREASPPPEGEVEARAEWERAQLRLAAEREKKSNNSARKSTFKAQLKPLQLVTAEESKRAERRKPSRESPGAVNKLGNAINESPLDESKISPTEAISATSFAGARQASDPVTAGHISPMATFNNNVSNSRSSSGGLSTQQLQRQVARDQRYSVNAVNIALGQKGVSDIGGAYPVFQSPSTSAINMTGSGQKYSGLMPQRSLVPPFELQNRPDGLPSALIGPDGVKRSPNDPEVCLECMMRDEDMIDVHVLGAALWERESDRDFEEAIRLEAEEDNKREKVKISGMPVTERSGSTGTHGSTLENATASTVASNPGVDADRDTQQSRAKSPSLLRSASPSQTRFTKIRVKRVAKGDPLTAERLKLHTQMNPPASSHRWRTLQTFLNVQARYIASEQKARGFAPAVPSKQETPLDNRMSRTMSGESKLTAAAQRQRVTSPSLFQVSEVPINEEEHQKERDIIGAREVRRRNNLSGSELSRNRGMIAENGSLLDEGRASRLSGSILLPNDDSTGHHSIPWRTNAGPGTFARGVSAQEFRTLPSGMPPSSNRMGELPSSSNGSSLAPPMAPFRATSSTPSTPAPGSHGRLKTASSQMSLAGSGSMIDMHVGMEDGKEHRIAQSGFMPGTPLHSQSPSVVNRAFYGFPGDAEAERGEYISGGSFGDYDDGFNASRESPEIDRKKKKSGGFRGFFGGRKSTPKESPRLEEEPRDSSLRRLFYGMDSALDLQPPPGIGGLLSRARRSTSSLLTPTGRQSVDSAMMLNNKPLMASQTSLELGPFGSGPLPPPRKESRFSQAFGLRPESPQPPIKEKSRLRTFSSGNLMSKKKTSSIPNPSSRSSSMMQSPLPVDGQEGVMSPNGGSYQQQPQLAGIGGNRSSGGSLLAPSTATSARRDVSQTSIQSSSSPTQQRVSSQFETLPRHSTNIPAYPSHQQQHQQNHQQRSSAIMQSHRANRSEGLLPMTAEYNELNASNDNGAPRRPPRSPHRENALGLPDQQYSSLDATSAPLNIPSSLQKEQYYHAFDSNRVNQAQSFNENQTSPITPDNLSPLASSTPSRKSRLLKLPFGKNKRESTAIAKVNEPTPSLRSQSSRGTFDDLSPYTVINNAGNGTAPIQSITQKSSFPTTSTQPGLDSLRGSKGYNRDRQTLHLDTHYEDRNIPPRSQSALGVLDGASPTSPTSNDMRTFLPRLRTNSRAALREVRED